MIGRCDDIAEVIIVYENGKQINHYANKMIHKRKLKDKYRRSWIGNPRCASWEDYFAHADDWDDLKYWKEWYLSGSRRFAKCCTNSALRSGFREEFSHEDYENMYAPQNSEYKRLFDYMWSVW